MTVGALPKGTLDFLVIGAQKAGTTSLFEHLRAHPQLYLPPGKEKPFFSHDAIFGAGWDPFVRTVFVDAPPDRLWGKATPWYMAGCPVRDDRDVTLSPEEAVRAIPERIHARLPDVRLVAILRDPVERCVSHFRMGVLGGRETRTFEQVVVDLLTPQALERARLLRRTPPYVTFGEYGRVLEGYYEAFPPEQILITFTNELEAAPAKLLRTLFGFLDIDDGFVPPRLETRFREGGGTPRVGWLGAPSVLQRRAVGLPGIRSAWAALPEHAQLRVQARLREVNYRIALWNRRSAPAPAVGAGALALLRDHYESDRRLLERLIGRPVPWSSSSV